MIFILKTKQIRICKTVHSWTERSWRYLRMIDSKGFWIGLRSTKTHSAWARYFWFDHILSLNILEDERNLDRRRLSTQSKSPCFKIQMNKWLPSNSKPFQNHSNLLLLSKSWHLDWKCFRQLYRCYFVGAKMHGLFFKHFFETD